MAQTFTHALVDRPKYPISVLESDFENEILRNPDKRYRNTYGGITLNLGSDIWT